MFCSQCGKELPEQAKFCPKCGSPVSRKDSGERRAIPNEGAEASVPLTSSGAEREAVEGLKRETVPEPSERREENRETPAEDSAGPRSIEEEIFAAILPDEPQSAPLEQVPSPNGEENVPEPSHRDHGNPPHGMGKRTKILLAVLLVVVLLCGGGFLYYDHMENQEYRQAIQQAENALEEGEFQEAIDAYQEALKQKPGDPEATMALAEVYLRIGDWEEAQDLLEELDGKAGRYQKKYQALKAASEMEPEVEQVDTENFPMVSLEIACGGKTALKEVTVSEDGTDCEVLKTKRERGSLTVQYQAGESSGTPEERQLQVTLNVGDFLLGFQGAYETPRMEAAQVELISTDVSSYPKVQAYFRVRDAESMETIPHLGTRSFQIRERVDGGEFVSREVHAAAPLEGKYGLNIDLVADKSDSISEGDMAKIQQVMTEFVSKLHYQEGDRAEILAFDSIVQQMCCYTKEESLLTNGISNMSTDGMTALYDALYMGVGNAALQGGARCVIGFTDGYDNVSTHSSSEVIDYAQKKQVPVYLIGVSSGVEEAELRAVAEQTGGRYWFIDDLYGLEEIFREIYAQQQKLYLVEYESDKDLDAHAKRELDVVVSGSGYQGKLTTSFQSAETVRGLSHDSRYELVKESLSWEQASRRCQEMGGHLATITSQNEMDQLTKMADAQGVQFLWLGGYTSYDAQGSVFGHWVTGEEFGFQKWADQEPSRVDLDGEPEWYIMLWNVKSLGGWTWNDQRNDPASAVKSMAPKMGFICEYEN